MDQRPAWWKQYAQLTGTRLDLPAAFSDDRLREVTAEPLLCYLLVLSRFAVENWEAAAENRNRIYERLINEVWRRGWGEGSDVVRRRGPGKSLSRVNFNRLMDTVAHAAWLGGDTRTCSEDGFHEAVALNKCGDAWEQFYGEGGSDIANLAMNFYLKASDKSQRGFEFTHKSFGDYLAARALVEQAEPVASFADSRLDISMQDWFNRTSTGTITPEIVTFVRDEFRLRAGAEGAAGMAVRIKLAFVKMASEAVARGFPQLAAQDRTYRGLELRQRNAEAALWMVMNGAAHAAAVGDREVGRLDVSWPTDNSFSELVSRLSVGWGPNPPILQCLSFVVARNSWMWGQRLPKADLRYADLSHANLACCTAIGADFSGANLSDATFLRADLDNAIFFEANVEDASFLDANIGGSDLICNSLGNYKLSELSIATQGRLSQSGYYRPTLKDIRRINFGYFDFDRPNENVSENLGAIARLRGKLKKGRKSKSDSTISSN